MKDVFLQVDSLRAETQRNDFFYSSHGFPLASSVTTACFAGPPKNTYGGYIIGFEGKESSSQLKTATEVQHSSILP